MPPEAIVRRLLRHVAWRVRLQQAGVAMATGAGVAVFPFIATHDWRITSACAIAAACGAWWVLRRNQMRTAACIEARAPECRNVLITAEALLEGRLAARPHVAAVVLDDASKVAAAIEPARLWPWHRAAAALAGAVVLWTVAGLLPATRLSPLAPGLIEASSVPVVGNVQVVVTPPAYAGRASETLANPDRLSALAGSRATVRVESTGDRVVLDTAAGLVDVSRAEDGAFTGALVIESDGYLAITPIDVAGAEGARRLIGVTAIADRPPDVRLTEPGKDLYLKSGDARVAVSVRATDDFGVRTLTLAYTKVAGAGESFTFTDGETPLAVTRVSEREWTATGTLPLDAMSLEVGDMVVYRGIATDGRPGAVPVESDAFLIEIITEGSAMAEGFSIDDRQDKYALSQQMVIIKTERLLAKAGSLTPEALSDEALALAAEQRSVRAEIVFMVGGEFEDEVVEAEHEHEVTDGRFDNTGRADLGRATRAMSRAATELVTAELEAALVSERAALAALQRALSRRRFILRTLTERERIDDTRRLQGRLTDLGRGERPVEAPEVNSLIAAARQALETIALVSRQPALNAGHAARLSRAAGGLLAADGRGAPVVDVAARLSAAGEAIARGAPDAARQVLADAATRLTAVASTALAAAPANAESADVARLRGALADALASGGRR